MTGPLSTLSVALEEMVDGAATFQAYLLRRVAADMADALDRQAMRDVEGADEWRDHTSKRTGYAS